jgi:gluconokinase
MADTIILMGVSGSGKTTIGRALASALGWTFYDGDDFHTPKNVEKMTLGIPLSDDDRTHWLRKLSALISEKKSSGENMVLACSALKRKYRQQLRASNPELTFVYLKGDFDLIWGRMENRQDHFMNPGLLRSQFEILEPPQNAITLSIDSPVSENVQLIKDYINQSQVPK